MDRLPYDITESMVQCFGRSFHYKDAVVSFMLTAGVDRSLAEKYRDEPKFTWARKVIAELGETEDGRLIQRKLLTNLCNLRTLPDQNVPDHDAGLNALRSLKQLALDHDLFVEEAKGRAEHRRIQAEAKAQIVRERAEKLEDLRKRFSQAITNPNRQQAGYTLEELLRDLFALFELDYRPSYKTATQQIDGHFGFESFGYLVEARWRADQPNEQEIGGFKQKVDSKLESTRGLFVSVVGFRAEVVRQFEGRGSNIIFMDGEDITHILEGRMDLRDALKLKIEKATQEGRVFVSLVRDV